MQENKLYVGNLNYSTTYDELKKLFSEYGEILSVKIIEGEGFGFVEFKPKEEAEKAKDSFNQQEIKGRTIKVDLARPPKR